MTVEHELDTDDWIIRVRYDEPTHRFPLTVSSEKLDVTFRLWLEEKHLLSIFRQIGNGIER